MYVCTQTYTNVVDKRVVDEGTAGEEEARSRTQLVEEEQLLLSSNLAVVALGGLLLQVHLCG
jgi:hypothetical protein